MPQFPAAKLISSPLDIDSCSLDYARQTLELNPRLRKRIQLTQMEPEQSLLKAVEDDLAAG